MSSAFRSKWFSIDAFPGPVMKSTRVIPTRVSSSTTYCTTGLRPTGSISFGCDFVAGSSRVPSPATGTTAISGKAGKAGRAGRAGRKVLFREFAAAVDVRAPVLNALGAIHRALADDL